ncbi:MAG: hypothetical protein KC912_19100 [Proteobacteria bacterium]|nr:hypothetical protein [Pseudomonadota bacterium]
MRIALLALSIVTLVACETAEDDETIADTDTGTDSDGPTDCSPENVADPINPGGGALAEQTINGATCDGWTDEFTVNVSTLCQIQTQVTFDDEQVDGVLVADGSLSLEYYAGGDIGTTERTTDGTTVTLTNNPTDDSFGAVRISVTHTGGEQLDYTLVVSTTCPQ